MYIEVRVQWITSEELIKIILVINKTTCLSDPFQVVNVSSTDYHRYHYAYD